MTAQEKPQEQGGVAVAQEQGADIGAPSAEGEDIGAPIGADKGADRIVYRDRERVALELSQTAGKGRVGKVDACKDCGNDFVVETYNGTRCKPCAEKAAQSYRAVKIKNG